MPAFGLCLRVTHTGKSRASLPLNDINDGVGRSTGDDAFRRFGPAYVPVDKVIELIYAGDVAKSFEAGTVRGYINGGHVTAEFFVGSAFAEILPNILDEGILLTPSPASIDFVGAGVTATAVGGAVTITIPGGGSSNSACLLWGVNSVGSSTTPRYMFPGFDNGLAQTTAVQFRVPRAATLRNLRVRHNSSAGNGNVIVYTLRVNGVASAMTASLASTGTDAADLVNTAVVSAGDLVDIQITKAATIGASPNDVTLTVEYA